LEIANRRIGKKVERAIQPLTRLDLTGIHDPADL